jgi:hypothetical protein
VDYRKKLERFASETERVASAQRVRIASQVLLLLGLVFVGLRFRSILGSSHVHVTHVGALSLIAAAVLVGVGTTAGGAIWLVILRQLGVDARADWMGLFFQAQVAKYIPGSVWQYAGRTTLARAHGIPARPVASSIAVELAASSLAGAVTVSLLAGPVGLVAVVVVAALALLLARRNRARLDRGYARRRGAMRALRDALPTATALYGGVWLVLGASCWFIARALTRAPIADMPTYIGAFAAAWLAGLFAIYAPGGLGVREAVLVALLRSKVGTADALVIAAVSRGIFTLIDVMAAGAGTIVVRRSATAARQISLTADAKPTTPP